MYITLSWISLNNTPHDEIEGEIFAEIAELKFRDQFRAYDGLIYANIVKGNNEQQAQKLYNRLMTLSPLRFAFVITVSQNGEAPFPSDDLTDPGFAALEAYQT